VLLAHFAVLALGYGAAIGAGRLPFNSGAWLVSEGAAMRGPVAYALVALLHGAAAFGLWRGWRAAHWLAILLIAWGVVPAVLGVSSAAAEGRVGGIALWGGLIILRSAALYMLFSGE
jgi:hypothetical protein